MFTTVSGFGIVQNLMGRKRQEKKPDIEQDQSANKD